LGWGAEAGGGGEAGVAFLTGGGTCETGVVLLGVVDEGVKGVGLTTGLGVAVVVVVVVALIGSGFLTSSTLGGGGGGAVLVTGGLTG